MSICGLVLLIVSSIMIVLQLLVNTKLIIMDNLRNEMLEYKKILAHKLSNTKKDHKEIAEILGKHQSQISRIEYCRVLQKVRKIETQQEEHDLESRDLVSDLVYFAKIVIFVLKDSTFLYFGFIFICSFSGFVNKSYFVYSLLLFEVVVSISLLDFTGCIWYLTSQNRFKVLKNIVKAIIYNSNQLLLTLLLGVVITYILSLFAYYYLIDTFWNDVFGKAGENQCSSVFHCFLTIYSLVTVSILVS